MTEYAASRKRRSRRSSTGCWPRRSSASAGAGTGSTWPATPSRAARAVNFAYPHAWRYRDYVIAAFNADKPYDQFIREQLAGDLLAAKDDEQKAELLIATGFLAIGPKTHNERNRAAVRRWTWPTSRSTRRPRRSSA